MRLGIFGLPRYPATAAFASGLAAVGHRVFWNRAALFRPDMVGRRYDAVVVFGLHRAEGVVADAYWTAGIPVVVIDLGHLRREWEGERLQTQLGLNRLGWLPPFPCPPDRWQALDFPLQSRQPGSFVLVVGQRPKDASHNLGLTAYQDWLDTTIATLRATTDRPLIWRPHPRDLGVRPLLPLDGMSDPSVPIMQALRGAHAMVTHCSTSGVEALIQGVPVLADPSAMYAPWVETDLQNIDAPEWPTDEARLDCLSRLGYAQWSATELRDGTAARFITSVLQGELPVFPVQPTMLVGGNVTSILSSARRGSGRRNRNLEPAEIPADTRLVIAGGKTNAALMALAKGASAAGYTPVFAPNRTSLPARPSQALVTYGLRAPSPAIHAAYRELGVPTLNLDLGHLHRSHGLKTPSALTGSYQLGLGQIGWLPPFACPGDRFAHLGIVPESRRVGGDTVLIASQKPGDASHGMSADALLAYGQAAVDQIRAAGWTGRIVWRAHPVEPVETRVPEGVTDESDPSEESMADWWPRLHALVTHCSTVGLEALVAGVPVFCDPVAMYAPLANTDLGAILSPAFPSEAERLAFLQRVAYAQWTLEELATAAPLQFVLSCVKPAFTTTSIPSLVSPALADLVTVGPA